MRLLIHMMIVSTFLTACWTKKKALLAELTYDTSRIAVLSNDRLFPNLFDNRQYRPSTLTTAELKTIDSLFTVCVTEYNNSLDSTHNEFKITIQQTTKIQIVVAQNKNGQKEVWVNSMCRDLENWNKYIITVHDGGPCYFNFRINLKTRKYFDLGVNGFA